ncbi:unnamed protein product [Peniophora sp. CBMAI 1063]|nr:unnamed protein product [Peniophora sp. CBMAI 1063]
MESLDDDQIPRAPTPVEDNDDTPRGSLCYPPSSQTSLNRIPTELFISPSAPTGSHSSLTRVPTETLSSSQQSQQSDGSSASTVIFIINPNAQTGFTGNPPTTATAVRAHSSLYTPTHLNDELQALVLERQYEQEAVLRQLLEGRGVQIYSRVGETQATTLMRLAAECLRSPQRPPTDATTTATHAIPARMDVQYLGEFESGQLWA